ncbi:MAG: hypothetical protein A2136_06350 [Chloroflexi bacterium RBG_16_54_11]|nr:MAG: hypothetical protein A2136_06350 [Chloroflexi bacterium RBG_16_54_11]
MSETTERFTKILVVDDEPNVLRMVGYALHTEGFAVVVAKNGAEALAKIQSETPDLVILDVLLPDISGEEVCKQLRMKPETLDLPIIMLSARSEVPDKVRGFEAGADEYIVKPITPEELIARIKALLLRYQQVRHITPKKPARVVGFIGAKGGVGTTTVALNIATSLALQQKKVLAAEVRSDYGTFSAQLNLAQGQNQSSIFTSDLEHMQARNIYPHLVELPSGLKLLTGPQKVADYRELEPQRMEAFFQIITPIFDYVILDISCHPDGASQAAIQQCGYVALVVEPESTSLAAGIRIADQLNTWGVKAGKFGIIVVNRAPLVVPLKVDQIKTQLGHDIIGVVPNGCDVFVAAQNAGLPVITYRPGGDITRVFSEITKKISDAPVWGV